MWYHFQFIENIKINLDKYGHKSDERENLVPAIVIELSTPVRFSSPCNYSKCSYANVSILCKPKPIVCFSYQKC